MLASLFRPNPRRAAVHAAYGRIVERARQPVFYTDWGVPDTLDGRFELLALHAFLVLNRLKRDRGATAGFAQALFDAMFADLDRALREMGVGDLSVGRRVKEMATGFYGRIAAYEQGLADAPALEAALRRNLYGTTAPSAAQLGEAAAYVRRQAAALEAQPAAALLTGEIGFAALEAA
ncbi:MAG TPA: ubiquinol-cytochrome C chaperone family protein [Stellaceae bacterium]|nr:ubiquinol-cytochrome C chaperone family protein [Stellaceae bacterium]